MYGHPRHTTAPSKQRRDWDNLRRVMPLIWAHRGRALVALVCLMASKLAIVGVPLVLKHVIDALDVTHVKVLVLPVGLLAGYGLLRLAGSLFNELRDAVFAQVRYRAMRDLSTRVLTHLYNLSLRFHLERRTGAISRDLERGTASVSSILNYLVFNIVPTAAEFVLVAIIFLGRYEPRFAIVTFLTVAVYIGFTLAMTNWRMHYRQTMNALDSSAHSRAVDGLLNYETVKYFDNEKLELQRYAATLRDWESAAVNSQTSMSLLNFGQGAIIAVGVTAIMFYAANGVVAGRMTIGDFVLVNTMMLQLFMPLNFLGVVYRALKYALTDMDLVFKLLDEKTEINDREGAPDLAVTAAEVRFEHVCFGYNADRQILRDVSFTVPSGHKVAVVGPSGAGKSTLARLLFRFYDVDDGRVLIDGQDLREVTQASVRRAIGIVPQDTVLFNDTIYDNIAYARPNATREEILRAARLADIHDFIEGLPQGYDTLVGERGLKLSGGEKQRVAIARVILKDPRILVFDEATSSLDSRSEQAILAALRSVAAHHTTLIVAHRLSTIVDADRILVMEQGRIIESGTHAELLRRDGLYARLWALQQADREHEELTLSAVGEGA